MKRTKEIESRIVKKEYRQRGYTVKEQRERIYRKNRQRRYTEKTEKGTSLWNSIGTFKSINEHKVKAQHHIQREKIETYIKSVANKDRN